MVDLTKSAKYLNSIDRSRRTSYAHNQDKNPARIFKEDDIEPPKNIKFTEEVIDETNRVIISSSSEDDGKVEDELQQMRDYLLPDQKHLLIKNRILSKPDD